MTDNLNKDKRISFLSVLSSLGQGQIIDDSVVVEAYKIVNNLFSTYKDDEIEAPKTVAQAHEGVAPDARRRFSEKKQVWETMLNCQSCGENFWAKDYNGKPSTLKTCWTCKEKNNSPF